MQRLTSEQLILINREPPLEAERKILRAISDMDRIKGITDEAQKISKTNKRKRI